MFRLILIFSLIIIFSSVAIFGLGYLTYYLLVDQPNLNHLEVIFLLFALGVFTLSVVGLLILVPWIIIEKVYIDCQELNQREDYQEL